MRKLLLILLFFIPFILNAQSKEIKTIIDTTIEIMKMNSVNSRNVDWNSSKKEAYKLAKKANSPNDLGNSLRFLFKSLNDFHGAFGYEDSIFHWRNEKIVVNEIYKNEFAKKGNQFITKSFDDIGYLRIPSTSHDASMAQALQDSLCKILDLKPKGLIFDLRLNGGGSMWPMILGVSNLLEKGNIGAFLYPNGNIVDWIIDEENISEGPNKIFSIHKKCNSNFSIPIVFITGNFTASAAEDLIVAFKTRANTVLIGEATAGYVTVNNGFKINKNTWINLSIAYLMDKNKVVYKEKIQPDILVIDGDDFTNLENDLKVKKAIEYISHFKHKE